MSVGEALTGPALLYTLNYKLYTLISTLYPLR